MGTELAAVAGDADASWVAVLEANTANIGSNPALVFQSALDEAGASTTGPDPSGEYSSNCPAPGHNGGTGDQQASLRWSQTPDGQIIFHCHAGCVGEDIVTSLGLTFTQLRWPRTEYYYRDSYRSPLATHVKVPQPNGRKKYWWEHEENGVGISGRGPGWESVLWCLPDLQQAAAAARAAGKRTHLWLCEGEKDAQYVAMALAAGWTPDGESADAGWVHLTTTSPDGAATWNSELSGQVTELGCAVVTVVCDSDEAGARRGPVVTEALLEREPTATVDTVSWVGRSDINDAAVAITRLGRNWLRESSKLAEADAYSWCSSETGWLYEADTADLEGEPTGRRALHRIVGLGTKGARPEAVTKWPVRVAAVNVDSQGDAVGWELDLGPGGSRVLRASDLVASALEVWNSKVGLFVQPVRSVSASLRAYLGHHGSSAPRMSVWEHEGWVDRDTFVTGQGILIGAPGLLGRAEAGATEWHFGDAGSTEAAQHAAELLTFRPLTESAPVLAWLAAVAVRPFAMSRSGAAFVPMLQVPGDSGTGKTSFLRLATRLFGYSSAPISNVTTAGLVRTLALSTQHVWIDDFANYDDAIRDIIRGGVTGAGRTRGTTASERGVVRDEARAALVNSGEAAMGLEERAMRQRSVVVTFTARAQGRPSRRPGVPPERGQYADMVELGVDRDDRGEGLSRWAGSVIRGLHAAALRIEERHASGEAIAGALDFAGASDGVREASAWRFVAYGADVLAAWLAAEGVPVEKINRMLVQVRHAVRDAVAAAQRREQTGADIHLITTLVPAYLRTRRSLLDPAVSAALEDRSELASVPDLARRIRDAWRNADAAMGTEDGRPARGALALTAPGDDGTTEVVGIALCAQSLSEWAQSDEGRRAGIGADRRFISREGIGMQVSAVTSRGEQPEKVRVKLSASQQPRYAVITDKDVIGAILGAE